MSNPQQPGVLDHPGARPRPATTQAGRPVGVMIIAAMFLFYVVVVGYTAFDAFGGMSAPNIGAAARSDARWALMLALVQLPFYAATAIGLWRLKEWGRYLALVFLAINIARFVVTAFFSQALGVGLLIALSNSIIPLTIMLYLLHPSIRPIFRPGR